jgi:hypothetical protein
MFQIRLFVTRADVFLQSEAADVLHTDLMKTSASADDVDACH